MTQAPKQSVDQMNSQTEQPTIPRVVRSEEILQGQSEIQIIHANETYRLRVTRNGKLILFK